MKQAADKSTVDMFEKPRHDRFHKPDAEPPAQRVREFRLRRKFNFLSRMMGDEK